MTDEHARYKGYISRLCEREAARTSLGGVTTWALVGGLVYMIWHVLPPLAEVRKEAATIATSYGLFSFLHLSFLFFGLCCVVPQLLSSPDDEMLFSKDVRHRSKAFLVVFVALFSPMVAQLYYYESLTGRYFSFLTYTIWFDAIIVVLLFTIWVDITRTEIRNRAHCYPSPMYFCHPFWRPLVFCILIFSLLSFSANSICAFVIINSLGPDEFQNVAMAGLDIFLIVVILIAIISFSEASNRLESIIRLERDIYLHNIDDIEIRERLHEELIGRDVGQWLEDKVVELRKESQCLLSDMKTVPLDDDERLPFTVRIDQFISEVVRLAEWLRKSAEGAARDRRRRIQCGFELAIDELERIVQNVSDALAAHRLHKGQEGEGQGSSALAQSPLPPASSHTGSARPRCE